MSEQLFQSSKLQRFKELRAIVLSAESIRSKIAAIDQERKRLIQLENETYLAKKNLRGLVENAQWQVKIGKADSDDRIIAKCRD
jgi:hypothetical protein